MVFDSLFSTGNTCFIERDMKALPSFSESKGSF
jgi:hypothetical protein